MAESEVGRRFPILRDKGKVRSVPWSVVEPLRDLAMQVHSQSLEKLASRGGLSRWELAGLLAGVNVFSAQPGDERVLRGTETVLPIEALESALRSQIRRELMMLVDQEIELSVQISGPANKYANALRSFRSSLPSRLPEWNPPGTTRMEPRSDA
jgi:hypothetical protein